MIIACLSFLGVVSGGSAFIGTWAVLGACARGSVTLCASVVAVADIGATFVEVDIQGLLMTVVFSLLASCLQCFHGWFLMIIIIGPLPYSIGVAYTAYEASITKRQICKVESPCE